MPDTTDRYQADAVAKQPGKPQVHTMWGVNYIKRKFREHEAETSEQRAARRTATATWWIAAFTIVLAIASIKTFVEIQKGGADTHALAEAAKATADAAKIQADAAIIQSEQTESLAATASVQAKAALGQVEQLEAGVKETHTLAEAARKQAITAENALALATGSDRPWIGYTAPTVGNFEADKPTDISIQVTNAGKSPARITELIGASKLLIGSFPKDPDYSAVPRQTISHTILVPGASASNKFKMSSLPQPIIDAFKKGTVLDNGSTFKLYIYSRATYEDIRTHTTHHTWACFYWDAKTETLSNCSEYNDAD